MLIAHLELSNFRKLIAVRMDLAEQTTLFVGANNSGKTSAMVALRRFLLNHGKGFRPHDLTLAHWDKIRKIGQAWVKAHAEELPPDLTDTAWTECMPFLDLWLEVGDNELHYVRTVLPTLGFTKGLLGLRLRLEPEKIEKLHQEFLTAFTDAVKLKTSLKKEGEVPSPTPSLTLWPEDLLDFLSRDFMKYLTVRTYVLNPSKLQAPINGRAQPQKLRPGAVAIEGNPLSGLIRVNEINAQRGFGETDGAEEGAAPGNAESRRLSEQLRSYYTKHLDPTDKPDISDLGALQAIEAAQEAFNVRLRDSFSDAFVEVEGLGYPGVTDPKIKVSTRLRAVDGIDHEAAVSFEIDVVSEAGEITPTLRLPENNNGLGYQNLISMIFRLMAFRDAWMRVRKAGKNNLDDPIEPLQLVLIEEPEAHLHAQVQQVFVRKAYSVLRKHKDLGDSKALRTQLIVSSHSSHVAHETPFSSLRYFRRLPAGMGASVPTSIVVNLSETFGPASGTERFVTRYLRSQHADLFFADAAILVEGPAERMLLPNFVRKHYPYLHQCYLSILEIGGSHAHTLRPLIEHLGLSTLIITDLDTEKDGEAVQPERKAGQITNNDTLEKWWPKKTDADELFDLPQTQKVKDTAGDPLFSVRVAYQKPLNVAKPGTSDEVEALPYTFEDALVFSNIEFFSKMTGNGLVKKFHTAINEQPDIKSIGAAMFVALKKGKKAEFALDVLAHKDFTTLKVPAYIDEGLDWLEGKLKKKRSDIIDVTKSGGSDGSE
ncbi:AAA family ATPase [Rhizobium sp. 768_B6_N1_8]|uniref:AAA family ATPase n=1 Tax=unclassified Rhizobium TaxID=2613769 RepID=UPI003F1E5E6F